MIPEPLQNVLLERAFGLASRIDPGFDLAGRRILEIVTQIRTPSLTLGPTVMSFACMDEKISMRCRARLKSTFRRLSSTGMGDRSEPPHDGAADSLAPIDSRNENDIALVALHRLEISDDERVQRISPTPAIARNRWVPSGCAVQHLVDVVALPLVHRDNGKA